MTQISRNNSLQDIESLQRCIRLVILLEAAKNADIRPISINQLHTFAYLSNVLSPVWNLSAFDGKVLKRRGGPFYPTLQNDLDRLVGMGVVIISQISHVLDEEEHWRLNGNYCLNEAFAAPILNQIRKFDGKRQLIIFLQELAYALSALEDSDLDDATKEDATYSDPVNDVGNVVDFAEWQKINFSANATLYFEQLFPRGTTVIRGELLHLYVHHLYRRLHGEK
jgi:hypothetical protein